MSTRSSEVSPTRPITPPARRFQHTLQRGVRLQGIGLHSGQPVQVWLEPAAPQTGIWFERRDLPGSEPIPATLEHVSLTQRATTLKRGNASVSTVEHLLAACSLLGLDNLRVLVEGPELPILDGSALPFYRKLQQEGGICVQPAPVLLRRVVAALQLSHGSARAWVEPASSFQLEVSLSLPAIHGGTQHFTFSRQHGAEAQEQLAGARTFGWLAEVEALQRAGLGRGGSLENVVVLGEAGVLNPEGLRTPDELVRHKALDALGDLMLLGGEVLGHFVFERAGHGLHVALARALVGQLEPVSRSEEALACAPGSAVDTSY